MTKELIPFDADRAIKEKLKCQLRNGDFAYILKVLERPLSSSTSIVGVWEFRKSKSQMPQHWYLDGKWNDLNDDSNRNLDIIGMYPNNE